MLRSMPWGLKRFQNTGDLHFVTFSCHDRPPLLGTPAACHTFEVFLERTRCWYGFYVTGYVLMPEHVHLLVSEPERRTLPLRSRCSSRMSPASCGIWLMAALSGRSDTTTSMSTANANGSEKLRYIHGNPVTRGLVMNPEDWEWSSYRYYVLGVEGAVEIESQWTARKRERMGVFPQVRIRPAS
jgi:putative transposase